MVSIRVVLVKNDSVIGESYAEMPTNVRDSKLMRLATGISLDYLCKNTTRRTTKCTNLTGKQQLTDMDSRELAHSWLSYFVIGITNHRRAYIFPVNSFMVAAVTCISTMRMITCGIWCDLHVGSIKKDHEN